MLLDPEFFLAFRTSLFLDTPETDRLELLRYYRRYNPPPPDDSQKFPYEIRVLLELSRTALTFPRYIQRFRNKKWWIRVHFYIHFVFVDLWAMNVYYIIHI